MNTFKVGDKVRFNSGNKDGTIYTVVKVMPNAGFRKQQAVRIETNSGSMDEWYSSHFELVKSPKKKIG